jgi:hypothetical protein
LANSAGRKRRKGAILKEDHTVLLGNATNGDAMFTINKQTIKLAPGAGAKGTDGLKLDLPPSKYKVGFKPAGQSANFDEV